MDGDSRLWSWILIALLIALAFFFAVVETAFASVSRVRLKVAAEKDDKKALRAMYVIEHFDRAITAILICTNILHLSVASIVTVNVSAMTNNSASWVTVGTFVTTLVVFFFGEMLPKSIARKYSMTISLATASILIVVMKILTPLTAILSGIGNLVIKLRGDEKESAVTEGEIYDLIENMTEEGTLEESQGELIQSAMSFNDTTVDSILTSRVDLVAMDIDATNEEKLEMVRETNHSRIPVYDKTIDNIIGILPIRAYIKEYVEHGADIDVKPLLDEPYFVPQTAKISSLLEQLSHAKQSMAVVADIYGGTLGVVTVEDILEELVGEIWDEDDFAEEPIVELADGSLSVNADEHVVDVLDELDLNYDEEEDEIENKIMSELAYEQFEKIPSEGDSFTFLGAEFTVEVMRNHRIMRLKARALPRGGEDE